MTKDYSDLFDRLRRAGVRKRVAKALSEIDESASKKAQRVGRSAIDEFRALADEIERRLPKVTRHGSAPVKTAGPATAPAPAPAGSPRASRARTPAATTGGPRRPATKRTRATVPTAAAASARSGARAPRGENKAKILESLKAGPQTASEIAVQTGIRTATVSSTLTKMAKAGEIQKADRGYTLPK